MAIQNDAIEKLVELLEKCGHDNWDSYGAKALTPRVCLHAMYVLSRLVCDDVPCPCIVPAPNGGIQLEDATGDWDIIINDTAEPYASFYDEDYDDDTVDVGVWLVSDHAYQLVRDRLVQISRRSK